MADDTETKRPTLFECQFITLSDFLTEDEHETVSNIITNDFSWGDTDVCLVKQESLKASLARRATWDRRDAEEMAAVQKVLDAMELMGDSVYVNLY